MPRMYGTAYMGVLMANLGCRSAFSFEYQSMNRFLVLFRIWDNVGAFSCLQGKQSGYKHFLGLITRVQWSHII